MLTVLLVQPKKSVVANQYRALLAAGYSVYHVSHSLNLAHSFLPDFHPPDFILNFDRRGVSRLALALAERAHCVVFSTAYRRDKALSFSSHDPVYCLKQYLATHEHPFLIGGRAK